MLILIRISRTMFGGHLRQLWAAALLGFAVIGAGTALLGLSGWFITAASAAGMAGAGLAFDVFRPAASVRFLALGRTVARYGERVTSHDAVLRLSMIMRGRILGALIAAPLGRHLRLRRGEALNLLLADIDALEGVPLRILLPLGAGILGLATTFIIVWFLLGLPLAVLLCGGYLLGSMGIFTVSIIRSGPASRAVEDFSQSIRRGAIDTLQARSDLLIYGHLADVSAKLKTDIERLETLRHRQNRIDRLTGTAVTLLTTAMVSLAIWGGVAWVENGQPDAAMVALGIFAAIGMSEAITPLRRALTDIGRMEQAAGRILAQLDSETTPCADFPEGTDIRTPLFTAKKGKFIALVGPSGSGKSTLLFRIAGVLPANGVSIGGTHPDEIKEAALRQRLTLVPQRSCLVAGTIAENIRTGHPAATDAELEQVMQAVMLDQTISKERILGIGGTGLSGGEARRVTLARALIRRPDILLLDEPTEGTEPEMGQKIILNIRQILPDTTIIMATHRHTEARLADQVIYLDKTDMQKASFDPNQS